LKIISPGVEDLKKIISMNSKSSIILFSSIFPQKAPFFISEKVQKITKKDFAI